MWLSMPMLLCSLTGVARAWEQIDKENALLLIVDIQVGLFSSVRDFDPTVYRNAIYGHAELANIFDLPVIMTTSVQHGPNGPLPNDMLAMLPHAIIVERPGEINAWDNAEFRAAVEATGKKQIILAGIMTDVCTAFLALSLREAGYAVWANAEASGTASAHVRDISNDRMAAAGVHVVSFYAIVGDLLRDWRRPEGPLILPFLDKYMPAGGFVARAHLGALKEGVVVPGEEGL